MKRPKNSRGTSSCMSVCHCDVLSCFHQSLNRDASVTQNTFTVCSRCRLNLKMYFQHKTFTVHLYLVKYPVPGLLFWVSFVGGGHRLQNKTFGTDTHLSTLLLLLQPFSKCISSFSSSADDASSCVIFAAVRAEASGW